MNIVVIGTDPLGITLAAQLAGEGHAIFVVKAEGVEKFTGLAKQVDISEAAACAGVILVATAANAALPALLAIGTAEQLAGKILIDVTNPNGDSTGQSIAQEIARAIPAAQVVKAFNTVTPQTLLNGPALEHTGQTVQIPFATDHPRARATVSVLIESLGFAPLDAGPLSYAPHLESLALLNRRLALQSGPGADVTTTWAIRTAEAAPAELPVTSGASTATPAMPVLFISHGSPMFAVEPGKLGPILEALGPQLRKPRAILVASPHWLSIDLEVTAHAQPPTIHDFGGFPDILYTLTYPAPGAPAIATEIVATLAEHGLAARPNLQRGLDHGTWVPLRYLYPQADIPVIQIAMNPQAGTSGSVALGRALTSLRERGVLIIGSGSITHNLRDFRSMRSNGVSADISAYIREFSDWISDSITHADIDALLDYRSRAPHAVRAHPTDEHLLPLHFAIGAAGEDWIHSQRIASSSNTLGTDCYIFGPVENLALAE